MTKNIITHLSWSKIFQRPPLLSEVGRILIFMIKVFITKKFISIFNIYSYFDYTTNMRKHITILSLIITLLLGSTSMLVIPNAAEASLFGSILKSILGESDNMTKGGGKSTDKIEVDEYTTIGVQYFGRGIRETLRKKYKCHSN